MKNKIRLADFIINTLADWNIKVAFLVTGGMAMHLNDALLGEKRIRKICCHHEQAAAFAAEGYGHVTGSPALVCVTAGPGSINSLTGVFSAYTDSIPMIVIAGQSKLELIRSTYQFNSSMRQIGEQEVDSIALATPITKYARRITDPSRIRFELEKAFNLATQARPGPVWLEIPLDIQSATINAENLPSYRPVTPVPLDLLPCAKSIVTRFVQAERPLIVIGPGVREAGPDAVNNFEFVAQRFGCPLVATGPQDTLTTDHPQYAGEMGTLGTRAGNLNVQNADLLLFLGVRCYLSLVTYNWPMLGRNAYKIVVDEDSTEFEKPCQIADEAVLAGVNSFLLAILKASKKCDFSHQSSWFIECRKRLKKFPTVLKSMRTVRPDGRINPYWFIEELFARLTENDVLAAGNASSSIIPKQAGASKRGQRFFSNLGCGSMGFSLPAGIGAAIGAIGKRIIVLEGDGSLMMNLQELQTLIQNNLSIILVILENNGYVSMRQTQKYIFGREIGNSVESGLSFPNFLKICESFGLKTVEIIGENFVENLDIALKELGPLVIIARLDPNQPFEPKVSSKRLLDGTLVSSPPEDMTPLLSRKELKDNFVYYNNFDI
ncbi:MAG: thiamine pyrophosphate-binding protein [Bifidobacteriaceae bacterium]|jgi:acetolactate synthase-1/2/3 large subunit|nr:thiamine pyrophosphate-binding protein [Bifidobacteriaceae bacterium]